MPQVLLAQREQDEAVADALRGRRWDVVTAWDGSTCMRAARQERPDVVVIDAELQDGSSTHVVQRLRALLNTVVTPIIGVADTAEEERAMIEAGAQECLQGNPGPSAIAEAVERQVDRELFFPTAPSSALEAPRRLQSLHSTQLLDTLPEEDLDRFTRLASQILEAPTALLSLVETDRQFFKSAVGLHESLRQSRQTPLTHSYCQWAVAAREPFVVPDAREDRIVRKSPAIEELEAISYCGVPIFVQGEPIGTLCVLDDKPRPWNDRQVSMLTDLAGILSSFLELRVRNQVIDD